MIDQATGLITDGSTIRTNITDMQSSLADIKTRLSQNRERIERQLTELRKSLMALLQWIDPEDPGLVVISGTGADDTWATVLDKAQQYLNGNAESMAATLRESGGFLAATVPATGDVDFPSLFGGGNFSLLLNAPFDDLLIGGGGAGLPTLLRDLADSADSALPQPSADDLRSMFSNALLDSEAIDHLNTTFYDQFGLLSDQLDNVTTRLTDRINEFIRQTISVVNEQLSAQLNAAVAPIGASGGWTSLQSVGIDGYALISQDEIERIHLGAEFVFDAGPEPTSYNAALDVLALDAQNGTAGCGAGDGNYFDVVLSTHDVTASMLGMAVGIKSASLGFTINRNAVPVAIFGHCNLNSPIDYEPLALDDLGLEVGVGKFENYFGATGSGHFDTYLIPLAALYFGKSCPAAGQGVLQRFDPEAGRFIGDISPLTGIYARGSVDMPVWNNGCWFTIGMGADVGAWYFTEPDPMGTIGALVGGSAYGRLGCLAALKGKITCMGQLSGSTYSFSGSGWAGAGVGDCSPGSWQSVSDVRHDRWCETGDATFRAAYDGGWEISERSVNCCD